MKQFNKKYFLPIKLILMLTAFSTVVHGAAQLSDEDLQRRLTHAKIALTRAEEEYRTNCDSHGDTTGSALCHRFDLDEREEAQQAIDKKKAHVQHLERLIEERKNPRAVRHQEKGYDRQVQRNENEIVGEYGGMKLTRKQAIEQIESFKQWNYSQSAIDKYERLWRLK